MKNLRGFESKWVINLSIKIIKTNFVFLVILIFKCVYS